ncbi:Transcription initiation factor tfiid subunit [Thalictrum thalictroides]|uniref:Transcription initiation factor tfiid subunit n=1 Tax=Thalictrum thalictroides TaxID=46969 RepID=A0A7J6W756_THATH|nr:Transcription initiation factor tfiid subunit [Thalictrum thalictroides]
MADKEMELDEEDLPRDAKIVKSLLKSMGVREYEPRVIHQFFELWYLVLLMFYLILKSIQNMLENLQLMLMMLSLLFKLKLISASHNLLHESFGDFGLE